MSATVIKAPWVSSFAYANYPHWNPLWGNVKVSELAFVLLGRKMILVVNQIKCLFSFFVVFACTSYYKRHLQCRVMLFLTPFDHWEASVYLLKGLTITDYLCLYFGVFVSSTTNTLFWWYSEGKINSLMFLMLICQGPWNWEKWALKRRNGRYWSRWLGTRHKGKIKHQGVTVMEAQWFLMEESLRKGEIREIKINEQKRSICQFFFPIRT